MRLPYLSASNIALLRAFEGCPAQTELPDWRVSAIGYLAFSIWLLVVDAVLLLA